MNVTYLIGNGFDLGIGLHTDFESFLKYYVNNSSPYLPRDILEFKNKIKQDTIKLWADFEKSFGEYISSFNDETINNYIKIYENILNELNNYLNAENDRFLDDISKEVQQIIKWIGLLDLESIGFRPAVVEDFYSCTEFNSTTLKVTYNFLSFNYTDTFDRIIKNIQDKCDGILCTTEYGNTVYTRRIGQLIHVHGKLNENMIMGVNDTRQLPFSGDLPNKIKRRMIKPEKNKSIGYKINEKAASLISNSTIICIYGMSIGQTDTIWWERLGKWIIADGHRKLIYFVFDKNVKKEAVYGIDHILDAEEMYCENLLSSLKVPKEKWEDAKKRIIVIINSKFMQMNKAKKLITVQG